MENDLTTILADLKEDQAVGLVKERLNSGDDPMAILKDARQAMEVVGKRYEENTYFIPDLVYSGEILKIITDIVKPKLIKEVESRTLGKVLIGTVAGDIHDIGKNIVSFLLEVAGFQVRDLGVDVPVGKFVEEVQTFKPDIVGLSCLLSVAFASMKETVDAFEKAGLRDSVKIMIGGGVVDHSISDNIGADGFDTSAMGAVTLSKKWLGIE